MLVNCFPRRNKDLPANRATALKLPSNETLTIETTSILRGKTSHYRSSAVRTFDLPRVGGKITRFSSHGALVMPDACRMAGRVARDSACGGCLRAGVTAALSHAPARPRPASRRIAVPPNEAPHTIAQPCAMRRTDRSRIGCGVASHASTRARRVLRARITPRTGHRLRAVARRPRR